MNASAEQPEESLGVPAHLLAELGLDIVDDGGGPAVALAPAPVLVDGTGHLSFGALGMLFDLASSTVFDRNTPRPFVHADITVHRLLPVEGEVVATARFARQGGRTAVIEVDLRDATGAKVATSTQQVTFKGELTEDPEQVKRRQAAFRSMFDGRCTLSRRLEDELGISESQPGAWSMPLRPDRTNGFGGLHGGVATTLVDVAASGAVAAAWSRPARTVSAAVRYLAPATVGPFLAQPEVLVDGGSFAVCRVPIIDTGDGDRLVILAEAHVTG